MLEYINQIPGLTPFLDNYSLIANFDEERWGREGGN